MNNEIKEILDKLKLLCYDDYCLEFSVDYIERKEEKLLLDCITNLQEGYEKEHYLVDKLTRQLNDEYKNTEYQCKQKEYYKSRIDKAIEYMDNSTDFDYVIIEKAINILQGSDK